MDAREKQIAPPKSWETFEDLCLALFKAVWRDSNAQKHGRRGQAQAGVDVFGSLDGRGDAFLGVQCKGKDQSLGAQATVAELEGELAKAEQFQPRLAHWTFATTAPTDAVLQVAARKLSVDRTAKGLFPVTVLGWGDIQALLMEHRGVLEQIYPELAFDFAGLIAELRSFSGGDALAGLRQDIAALAMKVMPASSSVSAWREVTFDNGRGLGPALMGRPLGPADLAACPLLPEARTAVAELERAFSARLEGQPGVGKSVCALQSARIFAARGWSVMQLADPRVNRVDWIAPADRKTLYIIDDAHLTPDTVLRAAEAETGPARLLLSTHNAIGQGGGGRGAIVIDAKRAVGVIAAGLRADRAATLAVVRLVDDRVGDRPMDESLDHRLDYAEKQADRPWQFCFILGGGWRRATAGADAARAADADLTLAAIALRQLASRDARPSREEVHALLAAAKISPASADAALDWLVDARLVIAMTDLRTPHQRFAVVVLGRILAGQDQAGREAVGALLNFVLEDPSHPLAGLRLLLDEFPRLDMNYNWTHLVRPESLAPLLTRCWAARSADERTFAMLILAELNRYAPGWPRSVLEGHEAVLADWFSHPDDPSGGVGRLTNSVGQSDKAFAEAMVGASDPERVAAAVSNVTAQTAFNLAEMLSMTGGARPEAWKARFAADLDRKALVAVGRQWPKDEPIVCYARLCQSVCWTDEDLALDMVEGVLPAATRALDSDPVSTFHELDDIASRVLRVLDVLGIYKGKHRPSTRGRRLAAKLCGGLKPRVLAKQLSAIPKRDFQQAAMLLSFLSTVSPTKFNQTVAAIDWEQVSLTIGDDWAHLFHEAEVFLGVCFQSREHRLAITALITRNADRIDLLAPRLALMAPDVAFRHVEQGRRIGLSNVHHVDWRAGPGLVANFADARPDLLQTLLAPAEPHVAGALSQRHPSFFGESALFLRLVRQFAPQSLDRLLGQIDVTGAEIGWATALAKGGASCRAAALLVEFALGRNDAVGALARRLRMRFIKRSIPDAKDLEPFS